MKKIINSIFSLALLVGLAGCEPEISIPDTSADPITSVTATVEIDGKSVEFTAYPVEGSEYITIEFPWFYPENSENLLPMNVLTNAKMTAVLADNVVIKEPLLRMDLTQENRITVVDQIKKEHNYIITGKITKFKNCEIIDFSIPELSLAGVVKPLQQTISILTADEIPPVLASVTISHHATISPDPRKVKLDFNQPLELTVTAHDGVTKKVYTVSKEIPPKLVSGMRAGSEKIIFEKKLKDDLGLVTMDKTTSIGVSGDNLIINVYGENPLLVDRYNGELTGKMDVGDIDNYSMTADDAGNILFCNYQPTDNILKMWMSPDVNTAPTEYITWDTGGYLYGRRISVQGSISGNAVITSPICALAGNGATFARWQVVGGQLLSQTPEIITPSGIENWAWNCDVCYVGDNVDTDYFIHGYGGRRLTWFTGTSNVASAQLDATTSNFVANSLDVMSFNGGVFLVTNQVNMQNWGGSDLVWLLDVSTSDKYSGVLDADYNGGTKTPAILWQSQYHTYGSRIWGISNLDAHSDTVLASSEEGYYMYLYFMFCNGYVVGVQFDCLDM